MKVLFKWWLILTLVSLGIYTPIYLFSNNAVDAVEEATLHDLLPTVGMINRDYKAELAKLERLGIETDKSLDDALDDNPLIEDYQFELLDTPQAQQIHKVSGLSLVQVTATTKQGNQMTMVFSALDKRFLKQPAAVGPMTHFGISNGEQSRELIAEDMQQYLMVLFAEKAENAAETVSRLEQKLPAKAAPEDYQKAFVEAMGGSLAEQSETAADPVPAAALEQAIASHIQAELDAEGGAEYQDAREIKMVDLNADGQADALVLYSIEGQGGGNFAFQTLAVFYAANGGYVFKSSALAEGSASNPQLQQGGIITLDTLTHSDDDARCCPSVEGVQRFVWNNDQLLELRN